MRTDLPAAHTALPRRRAGVRSAGLTALASLTLVGNASAQKTIAAAEGQPFGPLTTMSAEEQTRIALSTAPMEVSSSASVYILTAKGYVEARKGTNGFTCMIEREMLETIEPVCYDAEGTATTVPARFYREELRAKGLSEAEVKRWLALGYKSGRLKAPRKPGLVYMLARENWAWNSFAKKFHAGPPHYMLYAPYATQESVGGAPSAQVPFVLWPGQPDALIIIMAADNPLH